jgi:RNA polymerase sigma factor (TIGR02999 family)
MGHTGRSYEAEENCYHRGVKNEERIADVLVPRFLDELKRVARSQLGRVQAKTLQPTAIVNEVYLRLIRADASVPHEEQEFLLVASAAVRNTVLDYVRGKNRLKRGSSRMRVDLDPLVASIEERGFALVEIEDLLSRLRSDDPELASIVDFRVFLGFSIPDTARALGVSQRTADRRWKLARAMLAEQLRR